MFYCNNCAKQNQWPTSLFKSIGKCELCKSHVECNEMQSSMLPIRESNVNIKPFLKHYGDGTTERIKDVTGFEGRFMITDHGRLFSINGRWKGIRLLKHAVDGPGYYNTTLRMKPKYLSIRIHQLVGEYFVENPDNKPQLNHKDGNKLNNHCSNLEWCTIAENINHAVRTGLLDVKGEKHHHAKLKDADIPKIFDLRKQGLIMKDIGNIFGVSRRTIGDVLNRNLWTHIAISTTSGIK